MIIYLDESGDLGFDFSRRKTSKKFVITLLVCDDGEVAGIFRKAVRRTLKNKLNRKKGKAIVFEVKGAKTSLVVKKYFYRCLSQEGWRLYTVVLNKQRVYEELQKPQAKKKLNIYHEHSHENSGLQAADLFCWGVFRKYEAGDNDWYDVYRRAIAFETEYLA